MEVLNSGEYVENVPLHQKDLNQSLAVAHKAVARLGWVVVVANDNSLICQTAAQGYYLGEIVTINVSRGNATISSRPVNEYYWDDTQNQKNIAQFAAAVAAIVAEQEKADRNLQPMHREPYGALVPSKSYQVTPYLVYANALVYVAMVVAGISPLHPTAQQLFVWGGNFRPAVADGEWWRLITYMFLHGGAMHLLMNTFALLYIGMYLEPLLGKLRFASAYLLTGICAGLLSIVMHGYSVGVGASGAIFGMYGVFLSMLTTNHIQKTLRKTMLRSILFFVVLNLLYGLQGNTDNAAHIGGLLSGIIIGYAYFPGISKRAGTSKQLVTTAVIAAATVALTAFVVGSFV